MFWNVHVVLKRVGCAKREIQRAPQNKGKEAKTNVGMPTKINNFT